MHLDPLTYDEICSVLSRNEHEFVKVIKTIRSIDRDNNGYVTVTELDDILKVLYPRDFTGKDLSKFIKHFRSIQNKILVDYKHMKDTIVKLLPPGRSKSQMVRKDPLPISASKESIRLESSVESIRGMGYIASCLSSLERK